MYFILREGDSMSIDFRHNKLNLIETIVREYLTIKEGATVGVSHYIDNESSNVTELLVIEVIGLGFNYTTDIDIDKILEQNNPGLIMKLTLNELECLQEW